jgi:hypothetical protein
MGPVRSCVVLNASPLRLRAPARVLPAAWKSPCLTSGPAFVTLPAEPTLSALDSLPTPRRVKSDFPLVSVNLWRCSPGLATQRRPAIPRLFGAPELAPSGDGRLELFVFDIGGALWHIWQTSWSNGWSEWTPLDGLAGSWPASVAPSGDGRLELFVAAAGLGHAWQTSWSNGWAQWTTHGSPPPTGSGIGFFAPGIASNADGRLEVFVANGALWRLEQTVWSDGWSRWLPHGSPSGEFVVGPVAAGRTGDGRIEIFVVDARGAMWNMRQTTANGPGRNGTLSARLPVGWMTVQLLRSTLTADWNCSLVGTTARSGVGGRHK